MCVTVICSEKYAFGLRIEVLEHLEFNLLRVIKMSFIMLMK